MSVAVVIGPALACSGETYCAVPITMPLCVRCAASIARAIPKSVIFTWPSGVISRFPGLMSRCTMPASCAAASAAAACATTSRVAPADILPTRASAADSGWPSTSSITR